MCVCVYQITLRITVVFPTPWAPKTIIEKPEAAEGLREVGWV